MVGPTTVCSQTSVREVSKKVPMHLSTPYTGSSNFVVSCDL